MAVHDRIRLTGLLRRSPAQAGLLYAVTEKVRSGGASLCRPGRVRRAVERDLDRDAPVLVAPGLRGPVAADAGQPDLHGRRLGEVAPPALALGPVHADRHPVAVAVIPDGEAEGASAAPPGDGQQRQMAADQAVGG